MSVRGAKLLTLVLAGACGALLLLVFALQFGLGRGYGWSASDDDALAAVGSGAIDRQPFKLPAENTFAETTERPLFNEDRKPTPEAPPEDAKPAPPTVPLNVSLTGVILTPQVHIALLHDNGKNDQMSIKEGMPLQGDLGGWTLTKVKERSAMFKESSGDEVEVELSTAVAGPKPGAAPARPNGAAPATPPGTPKSPPTAAAAKPQEGAAQAEQMQRRIEERRKQMRDEAERLKQNQH